MEKPFKNLGQFPTNTGLVCGKKFSWCLYLQSARSVGTP